MSLEVPQLLRTKNIFTNFSGCLSLQMNRGGIIRSSSQARRREPLISGRRSQSVPRREHSVENVAGTQRVANEKKLPKKTRLFSLSEIIAGSKNETTKFIPKTLEDVPTLRDTVSLFTQEILDFTFEQKCMHDYLQSEKLLAARMQAFERSFQMEFEGLQLKRKNCSDVQVKMMEKVETIENRFVTCNRDGESEKCLRETEEKRQKVRKLQEELEKSAFECIRVYQKNVALSRKLEELKAESERKSEQYRLSYQFIESVTRFKVTLYDGQLLTGCIVPQHSTAKNSHLFQLDLREDSLCTSDWLWEKINAFLVPGNLPSRFLN